MLLEKIESLCAEKGISISRLEKECGLGNATVRGWDKSIPRADTIKAVADYFGVSPDEFLTEAAEMAKKRSKEKAG
ncbi:MAG: helix-turn-helix domain-containing protein [Clostridiales bacterium]|nr:helix-turn-helix domain-containing protein [Clostridiales bacterium]